MMDPIATKDAPAAIGPYSQAVRAGELVFLSGQIPLDPATGQIVPGDIAAQTERVLENLARGPRGRGLHVRRRRADDDLPRRPRALRRSSTSYTDEPSRAPYPARATVQVSALPRGAQVEIDAIAVITR